MGKALESVRASIIYVGNRENVGQRLERKTAPRVYASIR